METTELNEVVMYKLVTGEVIMGKLTTYAEDHIILEKPMTLMLDPIQGGVGMVPYDAIYTQEEPEEMVYNKRNIMHPMKVDSQFKDAYLKQTTGIETVPSQEIIA